MKNLPLLIATILGTVVMIVAVGWLFGRSGQSDVSTDVATNRSLAEANMVHVKGDPSTAPVVIVEFSDMQCPACKAAQPLIRSLLGQYTNNEVAFVYRHLPLQSIHPNAFSAAVASNAAGKQDKFWEFHDLLFTRQDEWASLNPSALSQKYIEYAGELELNVDQFTADLDDPAMTEHVQTDIVAATQLRVDATPTFFVNGVLVSTGGLASAVETALAAASSEATDSAELEASSSGEPAL